MSTNGEHSEYGKTLLCELQATSASLFIEAGFEADIADQVSNELIFRISQSWGGQMIYIPKGRQFVASRRDKKIYAAFTGKNTRELAMQFGLSAPYIYKIVQRMREIERRNNQMDMFGSSDSAD